MPSSPFNKEFKSQVVKQVLEEGKKATKVGKELELSPNMVAQWIREYNQEKYKGTISDILFLDVYSVMKCNSKLVVTSVPPPVAFDTALTLPAIPLGILIGTGNTNWLVLFCTITAAFVVNEP